MTVQIKDRISFNGVEYELSGYPLDDFLEESGVELPISSMVSTNWRGYVACWKIVDSKLYLVELLDQNYTSVNAIFPGSSSVFADWYCGDLELSVKKILVNDAPLVASSVKLKIDQGLVMGSTRREIEKVACRQCRGTGNMSCEQVLRCKVCNGKGWAGEPGAEHVCLDCNGNGKVKTTKTTKCKDCDGLGYHVYIMEIKETKHPCTHCNEWGDDDGDKGWAPCPKCDEERRDLHWMKCHLCKGFGIFNGWSCTNCQGTGEEQIPDGYHLEYEDPLAIECSECEGYGAVKLPCSACNGSGFEVHATKTDITPKN